MAGIDLRMYIDQVEESIDRLPPCSNCQYYDEKINSCNCNDWNKDCPLARFVKENNTFYSSERRKTGKWIDRIVDYRLLYFCSECGEIGSDLWKFCPYCGADMREEQDETSN